MPSLKALSAAILCALTVVSAAVTPFEARSKLSVRDTLPPACGPEEPLAVEFLRAFNPSLGDHFYTTNAAEMDAAVANLGYDFEGDAGRIYPAAVDDLVVPFYRAYNPAIVDHFYTINATEFEAAITTGGYTDEGIAGYIYPEPICGSLPFYRLLSTTLTDHFYTLSEAEVASAEQGSGEYTLEGIAGYIFSA